MCRGNGLGKRPVFDVSEEEAVFVRSPKKSSRQGIGQLGMPQMTMHNVLRRLLKFKS